MWSQMSEHNYVAYTHVFVCTSWRDTRGIDNTTCLWRREVLAAIQGYAGDSFAIVYFISFKFNNMYLCLFRKQVCVHIYIYITYVYIETICTSTNLGPDLPSYLHPPPALSSEFLLNELNLGLPTTPVRSLGIIPVASSPPSPWATRKYMLWKESESHSSSFQLFVTYTVRGIYTVHGILQARVLEREAYPRSRDLPNPGTELRAPALQVDSLPAEPQVKPKNTGMGSLSPLQQIFPTQESNRVSCTDCRRILYQLSYQGSPYVLATQW